MRKGQVVDMSKDDPGEPNFEPSYPKKMKSIDDMTDEEFDEYFEEQYPIICKILDRRIKQKELNHERYYK